MFRQCFPLVIITRPGSLCCCRMSSADLILSCSLYAMRWLKVQCKAFCKENSANVLGAIHERRQSIFKPPPIIPFLLFLTLYSVLFPFSCVFLLVWYFVSIQQYAELNVWKLLNSNVTVKKHWFEHKRQIHFKMHGLLLSFLISKGLLMPCNC